MDSQQVSTVKSESTASLISSRVGPRASQELRRSPRAAPRAPCPAGAPRARAPRSRRDHRSHRARSAAVGAHRAAHPRGLAERHALTPFQYRGRAGHAAVPRAWRPRRGEPGPTVNSSQTQAGRRAPRPDRAERSAAGVVPLGARSEAACAARAPLRPRTHRLPSITNPCTWRAVLKRRRLTTTSPCSLDAPSLAGSRSRRSPPASPRSPPHLRERSS